MASLPQVGLEAIIAGLPGFNAGAKAINDAYDNIEKKAANVEKATGRMGSAFSSVTSPIGALAGQFVGLGQNLLSFGAIAGGAALVGVAALTAGVVALGATALTETAKYERMSLSIQNLVAREISQGQVVEQQRTVLASLTAKETEELEKLKSGLDNEVNSRDVLTARIQEQKERIRQLTEQYGDQGLVVIKERAELQGMELDLADLNSEIDGHQNRISELTGKEGQLVTVMEKVRTGQMSMADAMGQATPRAQELLKWIQVLAIQSPFTQEGIADAFRTALAYGFTTEKAQRLTTAMVDFTAATGKTEQSANLIALALGQIQARGKLSAQELRQLSEQGVGVNAILENMGFSLDDVTNGLVDTDDFIEAVIQDLEIFKGAAKEQSNTLAGLTASLSDLKSIALREFFTGTFNAIRPYVSEFVGFLTSAALETGSIKKLGETLGLYVGSALKEIGTFISVIRAGGLAVFSNYLGAEGIPLWYELKELISNISMALTDLGGLVSSNLSGPMTDFTSNIIPMITQGIQFINDHFEELKGALVGIGIVFGGAIFAAIVAGILSLLTPINLIIAGAALLGAAWAGNWGDIQGKTFAAWAVIQPILQQIIDWLTVNIPIAIQTVSTFWTTTLMPALAATATFVTETLIPAWLQIQEVLVTVIGFAIENVSSQWTNILLPAMAGVWSFLSTSLFPLFVSIGNFFNAVFNKVLQAMAGLWRNIILPALEAVGDYLVVTFGPGWEEIAKVINENVMPATDSFTNDILPALTSALETVTEWIKKAVDFFNSLAEAVSNFELPEVLTEHSPSPFAQSLINIAAAASSAGSAITGMITQAQIDALLGVTRGMVSVNNAIGAARDTAEDFLEGFLERPVASNVLTQLTGVFRNFSDRILGASDRAQEFMNIVQELGLRLDPATFGGAAGLANLFAGEDFGVLGVLINAFDTEMDALQRAEQEMFLQAGKTALSIGRSLTGIIESSAEVLDARVSGLQIAIEAAQGENVEFEGQLLDNAYAQGLLNQALQDQVDIQDDLVTLQQNQMRLGFLESQLDLIQQITDAGLNVDDILGGLTLGLDASIPDMIAATNALIEAMINQVDQDLQLGSPSKVMIDKMRMAGAGMVKGLLSSIPVVENAMRRTVGGIIDVPFGQMNGGSNTTNHNNYFNMSVNSGAAPQAVVQQYEIMKAMVE